MEEIYWMGQGMEIGAVKIGVAGVNPVLNGFPNGPKDGSKDPVDSMDVCCQVHDRCYGFVDNNSCDENLDHKKKCDKELVDCLKRLPNDPKTWSYPPPTGT